jgi:hypothetical protein
LVVRSSEETAREPTTATPPRVTILQAIQSKGSHQDMHRYGTYGVHTRPDPSLRAADTDREATGERLRRHHADGRLDTEELQERIDRCYQAKTVGELEQLVTDLPPEPTSEGRLHPGRMRMIPLVPIVIAIVVISAVSGGHHGHFGLWLLIPLFFLFRFWLWPHRPWGMRGRGDAAEHRA